MTEETETRFAVETFSCGGQASLLRLEGNRISFHVIEADRTFVCIELSVGDAQRLAHHLLRLARGEE